MPASNSTQQGGGYWWHGAAAELPAGATTTIVPMVGSMTPVVTKLNIMALQAGGGGTVTVQFNDGITARPIATPSVSGASVAAGVALLEFDMHEMKCVGKPTDRVEVTVPVGVAISSFYIAGYRDAVDNQEI